MRYLSPPEAVYPDEVIGAYQAFIQARHQERPGEEARPIRRTGAENDTPT